MVNWEMVNNGVVKKRANGMVSGVCIKCTDGSPEVIMVENLDSRKPLGQYGVPGGRIRNGERMVGAMIREWREEVGQDSISFRPTCVAEIVRINREGEEYPHYFFLIEPPSGELRRTGTLNEVGPPQWFTFQDIIKKKVKVSPMSIKGIVLVLEKFEDADMDTDSWCRKLKELLMRS